MTRAQLKHTTWMTVAHTIAKLSTCNRLAVGCVLLHPDGSVAGTGYNGALSGQPHCTPEDCNPTSRCFRTRHAERSAMDYSTGTIATTYVTHEPCLRCTQDLIARGCKAVYWTKPYEIKDPVEAGWRARHIISSKTSWGRMGVDGIDDYGPGISLSDEDQSILSSLCDDVGFKEIKGSPGHFRPYSKSWGDYRRWDRDLILRALSRPPVDDVCKTPNGQTDGHRSYVRLGLNGELVCTFCQKP